MKHVIGPFVTIVLSAIVVLTVWTAAYPLKWVRSVTDSETDEEDELHKKADDSYLKEEAESLPSNIKGQVQPGSSELEQDQQTEVEPSEEILEIETDEEEEALRKF